MVGLREFFNSWRSGGSSDQPWFDQPNAIRSLEGRRKVENLRDEEFESLRHWAEHGYVVLRDLVPEQDLGGMMSDLESIWTTTSPIDSLVIEDVRRAPGDPPGLAHSELVSLDQENRSRLKREYHWRIHGFYRFSDSARRILTNHALNKWASLILGRPTEPSYTINFTYGSKQALHQDTAVFYVWPMNNLVGVWIACEDIHPDSGPLIYYPGSHKEKLFPGFPNYPQVNLKNCEHQQIEAYYKHMREVAKRYQAKTFIAKRGEIFLWHGMLIHGGSEIRNPSITRRSYVCHYLPPTCDKSSEAKGPFNW